MEPLTVIPVIPPNGLLGLLAIDDTICVAMPIFLIELLNPSAMKRFVPSVVIPVGLPNRATGPMPSTMTKPHIPAVPAKVVTEPDEITIFRIVKLIVSVT